MPHGLLSRLRRLIIDYDNAGRHCLRVVLEQLNYRVSESEDGFVAIKQYTHGRPDLVFCALYMRLRDGLPTIREIRALDPTAQIFAMMASDRETSENTIGLARYFGAARDVRKLLGVLMLAAILDQFGLAQSDGTPIVLSEPLTQILEP